MPLFILAEEAGGGACVSPSLVFHPREKECRSRADQTFCVTQPVTCGNVCPLWRLPRREEDQDFMGMSQMAKL